MSINKTYAVLGLGRYGKAVAEELVNNGAEVLAVDLTKTMSIMQLKPYPFANAPILLSRRRLKGSVFPISMLLSLL